jgi:glutathione S-transferase
MLPLLLTLILGTVIQQTPYLVRLVPYMIRREINTRMIEPNLKAQYALIEEHLSKNEWFAGSQISGADIQMVFPIDATAGQVDGIVGEHTLAWLEKVRSRPAYIRALEKGGPFDMQKL